MNRLCHIYKNVNVILSSQAARGAFMSTEVSGTTAAIATSTPGRPRPISERTGLLCFLPGRETGKGRAWEASELRLKSFDDLQKLWVICVREQNYLHTQSFWRKIKAKDTSTVRMKQVKQTMARIKQILSERAYAESTPEARAAALDKINAR